MSREKMLEAEVRLKDEQLADLKTEAERWHRRAEELEAKAQTADAARVEIGKLKETIGKLAPAAKRAVELVAELNEVRRTLTAAEKERVVHAAVCSQAEARAEAFEKKLAETSRKAIAASNEGEMLAEHLKTAQRAAERAKRQSIVTIAVALLLIAGAVGGGHVYLRFALAPPSELSAEALAAFKDHAKELRAVIRLATEGERAELRAEQERLAAERNRQEALNGNTSWDKIGFFAWRLLIFAVGFIVGFTAAIIAFLSYVR